VPRGQMLPHIV